MKRRLYDISPPISPALAVWPGDTPPSRQVLMQLEEGASVTLSTLKTSVHLGAHVDAPNHYTQGAPSIGERPLEAYLGACEVVRVSVPRGSRIPPMSRAPLAERVL